MKAEIIKFGKKVILLAKQNSPHILAGLAIGGVVTTVVLATKAQIKADEILSANTNLIDEDTGDFVELTIKEKAELTWQCYIPTAISAVATIGLIIGVDAVHTKRAVALAGLCTASQKALEEYQNKVIETEGKKKHDKIQEDIAQDILDRNPVDKSLVIRTGQGGTLCYDVLSGRYFYHDINKIHQAINEYNHALNLDYCKSLNEFYQYVGLDDIGLGDECGWGTDHLLEPNFKSKLASDGTPCLVMDYVRWPSWDYRSI